MGQAFGWTESPQWLARDETRGDYSSHHIGNAARYREAEKQWREVENIQ